jgi:hypothetical protein
MQMYCTFVLFVNQHFQGATREWDALYVKGVKMHFLAWQIRQWCGQVQNNFIFVCNTSVKELTVFKSVVIFWQSVTVQLPRKT